MTAKEGNSPINNQVNTVQLIPAALFTALIAPLLGAAIAGILGYRLGHKAAHYITISGIAISFLCAIVLFTQLVLHNAPTYNGVLYTWGLSSHFRFDVGFLVDRLTSVMMLTVTFVSLLVHIYSIGYMKGDSGYARFFSYMSLFTFFMLVLVSANNFLLLFFGWEGVGLVSYLLIGFWFQRDSAADGGLKAFIVNRVGDFGFILGVAAIFAYFGSLDYVTVFQKTPALAGATFAFTADFSVSVITLICLLLFIGAMAKSAQVPLHVWLPESMEGPTPISALIHAATMVTAGVYMVARLSPIFEYSETVLSVVLVTGATGALFLGVVALVQNDIKRVIAYSTMSQLGYMMAATGVSAFSAGIFHMMTHASFKALLFLAAGSVIIALHHEQDMRKMGGLRKSMPITYITFLIGALALTAIPPFAGFYSKDAILEVVHLADISGSTYAYVCLLLGGFFTGLYIFRALFMTFHGKSHLDSQGKEVGWAKDIVPCPPTTPQESPPVVTIPLIILAIASIFSGMLLANGMLYDINNPLLGDSIFVAPDHHYFSEMITHFRGVIPMIFQAFQHLPFWFCLSGIFVAWLCYVKYPQLPTIARQKLSWLYEVLIHKYGFDALYDRIFVRSSLRMSHFFFDVTDVKLIDGLLVDGSGRGILRVSAMMRKLQSGYVYQYALAMVVGLFGFLVWVLIV